MFKNRPVLVALKTPGLWALAEPLSYDGEDGLSWRVPEGFVTDLASIPALFRSFFNSAGQSRAPAILHDFLYLLQPVSRKEADRLFLEAMKAEDVSFASRVSMWAAVRVGGWLAWRTHAEAMRKDPESWLSRHGLLNAPVSAIGEQAIFPGPSHTDR
jgi:hypothetical protein